MSEKLILDMNGREVYIAATFETGFGPCPQSL